jgi:preprotein translocase SecE subunit
VAERKKATKSPVKKAAVAKSAKAEKPARKPRKWTKPFRVVGGYFKGAWVELRQVRWPDRKATWSLTLAVILFSLFFALVILGLDWVFSYLFKEVLL